MAASQLSLRRFSSGSSASTSTSQDDGDKEAQSSDERSREESSLDEGTSEREMAAKRCKITHHRKKGVSPSWLREFLWLHSVWGTNGKIGMRCHLCTKHSVLPRSGSTSWTSDPCFCVRRDKVVKHAKSKMHKRAEVMEASSQAGGIPHAFDDAFTLEMKALGAVSVCTGCVNKKYHILPHTPTCLA